MLEGGVLSKKEMIQLKNMESMKFREDNSHQLRKELSKRKQGGLARKLIKSILSMDHNADLYNGTASTFYPLGECMLNYWIKATKKNYLHQEFTSLMRMMWNSILEILERKWKMGSKSNSFMTDIGCMATLAGNYTKRSRKMRDAHKLQGDADNSGVYQSRDTARFWSLMGRSAIRIGVNLSEQYVPHWAVWSLEGQCHPFRWTSC